MREYDKTIYDMLSFKKGSSVDTGWTLNGTAGGSLTVGMGKFAGFGSSKGKVFLSDPSGEEHTLDYVASEKYVGVGLGTLIGFEGSSKEFPAEGIGPLIYSRFWTWNDSQKLEKDDLRGAFFEIELGAGSFFSPVAGSSANSHSYSLIFMGAPTLVHASTLLPGAALPAIISTSKVCGVMTNTSKKFTAVLDAGATTRCGVIL